MLVPLKEYMQAEGLSYDDVIYRFGAINRQTVTRWISSGYYIDTQDQEDWHHHRLVKIMAEATDND